jgi:hypothetical protein
LVSVARLARCIAAKSCGRWRKRVRSGRGGFDL